MSRRLSDRAASHTVAKRYERYQKPRLTYSTVRPEREGTPLKGGDKSIPIDKFA